MSGKHYFVNDRIFAKEVRLIDVDGKQLGVVSKEEALRIADEKNLDLILVASNTVPPVCRIGDFGKLKYEVSKKEKLSRKSSKVGSILKELKMTPKIEEHDFQVKVRKLREFISKGFKIKVTMMFRGREVSHAEIGAKILQRMLDAVADTGKAESLPKLEGKNMIMIVAPQ